MTQSKHTLPLAVLVLALGACSGSDPATANTDTSPADAATPSVESQAASAPEAAPGLNAEMREVFERFNALRSYHATMQIEGTPQGPINNELDFVAPDRYRMTLQAQGMQVTQTMIGNDVYVSMGGRNMRTTAQGPQPGRWHEDFNQQMDTVAVEAQGSESLDGVDTRKYLLRRSQPSPSESLVWIDADDLVRQARIETTVEGNPTTTTIRYSRFDDPSIRIDAP